MRAAVVVFPGSNCDLDAYHVLKDLLGIETTLLWYREKDLSEYDLILLPGGFAYGDYLRAGAIARFAPVVQALPEYIEKQRGLVLGICNGFQVLTEAGLLPGALAPNINRRFICKSVKLRVENAYTPFTQLCREGELLELPIAHGEGRYIASEETIERLKRNRQILFRYDEENPNGSLESIAGIMDETGTVFGMMPHPERNCERLLGSEEGLKIFQALREALTPAAPPLSRESSRERGRG
jgi:phosphoribosylformylglycinamidine synthase